MAKTIEKIVAYVTRENAGQKELLVFEEAAFPEAGIQVLAVTIEPQEGIEQAILREVRDMSGLAHLRGGRLLGRFEWYRADRAERHIRHVFHFPTSEPVEAEWTHRTDKASAEHQRPIRFYWMDINQAQATLSPDLSSYLKLI